MPNTVEAVGEAGDRLGTRAKIARLIMSAASCALVAIDHDDAPLYLLVSLPALGLADGPSIGRMITALAVAPEMPRIGKRGSGFRSRSNRKDGI